MPIRRLVAVASTAATLALLVAPKPAAAVRAWEVLESPHFSVHYYPGEERTARRIAADAEDALPRLMKDFGVKDAGAKIPVIIDQDSFFNGEAEPIKDRIQIDPLLASSSVIGTRRFISHELAHVVTFRALSNGGSALSKLQNLSSLPSWLLEGLAQYEGEWWYPENDRMLRLAALDNQLLTTSQRNNFQLLGVYGGAAGYNEGYSFTRYLFDTYGKDKLPKLFETLRSGKAGTLSEAFEKTFGKTLPAIQTAWEGDLRERYKKEALASQPAPTGAVAVVATQRGDINVAPRLSPDGTRLAYLTSRHQDGYIYLRGQVMGALTLVVAERDGQGGWGPATEVTAGKGRASAFCWSADGRSVVISYIGRSAEGAPAFNLMRYDLNTGRTTPIAVEGSAFSPAWRPGSQVVAFVQVQDGRSQLMVTDLSTGKSREVPADLHDLELSDLAWSPDGGQLAASAYLPGDGGKLVLIDPKTGALTGLTSGKPEAADKQPVWTADGKAILFTSSREGRNELYRLDLASRKLARLTRCYTGPEQPCPMPDGRVLFVRHHAKGSDLMAFRPDDGTPVSYAPPAGALVRDLIEGSPAVAAVPADLAKPGSLPQLGANPEIAGPGTWTTHPYQSELTNDLFMPEISQDESGEAIGGTTIFSDVLDHQQLAMDVRFGIMSQRFSYQAQYVNKMWDLPWAVSLFDVPDLGLTTKVDPTNLYGAMYWERRRGVNVGTVLPVPVLGPLQLGFTASDLSPLNANLGWALFGQPFQGASPDPSTMRTGLLNTFTVGWSKSQIAHTDDADANPSAGYALQLLYQLSDHSIGSGFDYSQYGVGFAKYVPVLPDLRQNLAWTINAQSTAGDAAPLFLGGVMGSGPFLPVRGFMAASVAGSHAVTSGLEYTAPINNDLDFQFGPFYFNRAYLVGFVDAGAAWTGMGNAHLLSSEGLELKIRTSFMGRQLVDFRLGLAHPNTPGATVIPYLAF